MNITSILITRTTPYVYTTFMYTRLFVDSWRSYIGELRRTANGLGKQHQFLKLDVANTLHVYRSIGKTTFGKSTSKRSKGTLLVILHYLLKNNMEDHA